MPQLILIASAAYVVAGVVFAVAFAVRGVAAVDISAHGAPVSFRLLIVPGATALWPLLVLKWIRAGKEARP